MTPRPEEPAAGPWRVEPVAALADRLVRPGSGPAVVAVDGRGGRGKSTLADRLAAAVPSAAVVHTDDVAWHEPSFSSAPLLAEAVALRHEWMGQEIAFRARERPWERADVVVAGTPSRPHGPHEVVLADGPLPTPLAPADGAPTD